MMGNLPLQIGDKDIQVEIKRKEKERIEKQLKRLMEEVDENDYKPVD